MSRTLRLRDLPAALRGKVYGRAREVAGKPALKRKVTPDAEIRREKARMAREAFFAALDRAGIRRPVHEFAFLDGRRFRFDYAWPESFVALEVDGGLFSDGGHVRGAHIRTTHEKMNRAAGLGWRVLYTTPEGLCTKDVREFIRAALEV